MLRFSQNSSIGETHCIVTEGVQVEQPEQLEELVEVLQGEETVAAELECGGG